MLYWQSDAAASQTEMESEMEPQNVIPSVAKLLKPDDVADLLGIPIATIYVWRTRGRGPRALKVGKHLRYRAADVESWLESQADGVTR